MTRHVDERHLWPHHGEQIAPDEAARVADHLARCARCRRRYEAVRDGLDALTRAPRPLVPCPPTLWNRVEAALDAAAEGATDKPARRRRSSAGFLVRLLPVRPAFSMASPLPRCCSS
jgi:anti-sigma factor RsiW